MIYASLNSKPELRWWYRLSKGHNLFRKLALTAVL